MHKLLSFSFIETVILVSIVLFISAFFNEHMTAIKSIGIGFTAIFGGVILLFHFKTSLTNIRNVWKQNRIAVFTFIVMLIVMFVTSLFAYEDASVALRHLYKEVLYTSVLLFVFFLIKDKQKLIKFLLFACVLAMFSGNIHFFIKAINELQNIDYSFRIDRHYSVYFMFIYPFVLVSFFAVTKNIYKLFIFILLLFGVVLMFYTGARGVWLSTMVQTLVIFYFLGILFSKQSLIVGIIVSLLSIVFIFSNELVASKFTQDNTSGRWAILHDRAPIILENLNLVHGLGYGTQQYTAFMNDYNAPQRVGAPDGDRFIYYHDEPYYISYLYHHGYFGLMLLIGFTFMFLRNSVCAIHRKSISNSKYFAIATIASFVGVFLVRGVFEGLHFNYLMILFSFYLLYANKKV